MIPKCLLGWRIFFFRMKILRDSSACLLFFFWFQLSLLPIDVVVAEEDCNLPVNQDVECLQLNDVGACTREAPHNDSCGIVCAFDGEPGLEMTCQNETSGELVCRTRECNPDHLSGVRYEDLSTLEDEILGINLESRIRESRGEDEGEMTYEQVEL